MADAFYDEFRDGILGNGNHAQPDLDTNDIRCALRDEGTAAVNLSTHDDLAALLAADASAHVATSGTLTKTVGSAGVGAFDHTQVTFSTVSGASVESIDYYDFQTATNATSPMICNIDSATGLPVTPNGGDITWDPAAGGVFQLLAS